MRLFPLLILFIASIKLNAQCFEIESILVDGCAGSQEGQNEMVRFKVGASNLNTSNLSVTWPNNSWLGICQNATTASAVNQINSTITGCGFLKEPVGGVLPANSRVILVTSTAFTPLAQSFANLSDTLYIIFQCAGNTAGHFANYASGGGLRTLSMSFSPPSGCTDVVTYDRALLVNQSQLPGAQDGATVEFTPSGTATYVNYGCQAPITPFAVDAGSASILCTNATQSLSATATGAYSTVQWSLGANATGSFSPSNTLNTIYTPGSSEHGIIKLYCTVSKSCGTQTLTVKDSVSFNVIQAPQPVVVASTMSFCPGQSSVLSYSLSNAGNTGTTSVLWFPGNQTTPTISVSTSGTYSVQISNGCGAATSTVQINALSSPTVAISASGPTQFCTGGSVVLTANASDNNYIWNTGALTSTVSVSTTTTAIVTVSNSCGTAQATQTIDIIPVPTVSVSSSSVALCSGQTATIQATSNTAVTYSWSTGSSSSAEVLSSTGVYTVSASNACGVASETVSVTTGTAPSMSVVASQTLLCGNQSALLSVAGSQGNIVWSNSATSSPIIVNTAGVYTATLTNACGTATADIAITSSPNPTVSINPSSVALCPGHTATLTATGNTGSYNWSTGDNTNTIYTSNAGVYTVSVTNTCGTKTASVVITPISFPSLTLTATSNTVCPGETATLTVSGGVPFVTGSPLIYNWSNSASTASVVTTNGGTITVSNTNVCGTNTASIIVDVVPVNASIVANPLSGVKPLLVNFTDNSTGASTYLWDFGNGNTATTQTVNPQTYNIGGTYWVYLFASNGLCSDLDSVMIMVYNEEPGLVIPNVFTPNGDSANDVFKVRAFNIIDFECIIYDRWGLEMYRWTDAAKGWDGKSNGKEVPQGTYFYLIQAKDIDNKEIKKQGTVNLFK